MRIFSMGRTAFVLVLALSLLAGCGAAPAAGSASSAAQETSSAASSSAASSSAASSTGDGAAARFPAGEYRAMWISYLDWESVDFSSEEHFTADISVMLDNCQALGLNVVLAQVRPFGDALYPSALFPFSSLCTGTQGQDPGYDPLAILLREAHSRNLQLEAWLNPYRLRLSASVPAGELASSNLANTHPDWVKETDGGLYLNPASAEVRSYIADGVAELLQNYSLDGIQLDDYFYPTADETFDAEEYAASGSSLPLADWRRDNVNQLIQLLYSTVREQGGQSVRFGVSPQGNNDNNYNNQYSDIALWLSTPGYVDYILPQLYWGNLHTLYSGSERFAFGNVAAEWAALPRAEGVRLLAGLGAYRLGDGDGCEADAAFWKSGSALAQQVEKEREAGLGGFALYRYDSLYRNANWAELAAQECAALAALG